MEAYLSNSTTYDTDETLAQLADEIAEGCPEYKPDIAAIQAQRKESDADEKSMGAEAAERDKLIASGEFAEEGSHLVGDPLRPGTWRSVGKKVSECYWEISDSTGETIDNNFISTAPQFTIEIPASAAGFTNEGCEFERIGD